MCVPTPATDGVNCPPLTPAPLYVPPAGLPWLNVIANPSTQIGLSTLKLTVGSGLTTIVCVALAVQQIATAYVWATVTDVSPATASVCCTPLTPATLAFPP